MKIQVDNYKFDKILSKMGNEYGKIRKGDEEPFEFMLYPMESNLLKLHRINKKRDDYCAIKAIKICLFTIDEYINDVEYDLDKFMDDNTKALANGLLMAFDPFTNEDLRAVINLDLNDKDELRKYFKDHIKCLIRIESSIEFWTKEYGASGYFMFTEDQFGAAVKRNDKMDFVVGGNIDIFS
ncbi:MAG: hypothetical protein FWC47_10575 [Oscillospiraceae bacterium]|nr:hypothetical protein [Oscillospiraceae bacterium]